MEPRPSSIRLARISGIDIFVHFSWIFVAGLVLLGFWGQLQSVHPDLDSLSLAGLSLAGALTFFGSVLLHELAHALVAKRRGIEVKGITLYLFGGATEADPSGRSAVDEFIVAIVGPLTSLGIAAALMAGAMTIQGSSTVQGTYDPLPGLLRYLALINVVLALFNMAPGLPLDGGRVFRATVWGITGDFDRATAWATNAGVAIGYGLTTLGLLSLWQGAIGGLWLVAIGWVISQSARQNQKQEQLRSTFADLVAGDLMTSPVITIPAEISIADAVRDYFARRNLTVYPVVDRDRILGLLTVAAVRSTPAAELWKTTAGHVAAGHPPALTAEVTTPMSEVIAALSTNTGGPARVLVVERGRLIGIISPTDIFRRHSLIDLLEPALEQTANH